MVYVEMVEAPQRDWWVVADGRVVGIYLTEKDDPDGFAEDAYDAAAEHANRLRGEYGLAIHGLSSAWRSSAFDHLEDLSCRRSTCCRFIPRFGPADWEGDG